MLFSDKVPQDSADTPLRHLMAYKSTTAPPSQTSTAGPVRDNIRLKYLKGNLTNFRRPENTTLYNGVWHKLTEYALDVAIYRLEVIKSLLMLNIRYSQEAD